MLLVIATGPIKKQHIFKRIHALDIPMACVNTARNWAAPYVAEWLLVERLGLAEVQEAVAVFLSKNPAAVAGVIAFDETGVIIATAVARALGLPHLSPQIEKIRHKNLFRAFCQQQQIDVPHFAVLRSEEDCAQADALAYPLILKPALGFGSACVVKIEAAQELPAAFQDVRERFAQAANAQHLSNAQTLYVLEEYFAGAEVDVDLLVQQGAIRFLAITDNFPTQEPYFIETGGQIPSALPEAQQQRIIQKAHEIVRKCELRDGCFHLELKLSADRVIPIELNSRMGGAEVYCFIKETWGVDLVAEAVNIALGRPIPDYTARTPRKVCRSHSFIPARSGRIAHLTVNERLQTQPYFVELVWMKQAGESIRVPPEGYEYLGWLVVSGPDHGTAQANLAQALAMVAYEITAS